MLNLMIFYITTVIYLIFALLSFSKRINERYPLFLLIPVLAIHSTGLIVRWVESYEMGFGHAPLSNYYESLIFFTWCITSVSLIFWRRIKGSKILSFALLGSFLIMAYANFSPGVEREIRPLVPALKSNWLHLHVITCFLSYAFFFLSFLCGLAYLLKDHEKKTMRKIEDINYLAVGLGFVFLTMGILSGSVWAHYAWGSYWSWDPKETWSLITWIVYAFFLHARFVRGWPGKRMAYVSVIGFLFVLFTYFGVNFLLSGLHSYAT